MFASGFAGFCYEGVTGLMSSEDGRTLFLTDDRDGAIYAIRAVPEPTTLVLLGLALAGLGFARRRKLH